MKAFSELKQIDRYGVYCLIILLIYLLFCIPSYGQYKVTTNKVVGWSVLAVGGFVDGVVEGYEFDHRTSFERKWGVDPHSFFGSLSWQNKHTWYAKNFGVPDFYHFADDIRKISYISGGVVITLGEKQNWKHTLIDLGIGLLVSSGTKSVGLKWVRK